jgi:hypothetical protein
MFWWRFWWASDVNFVESGWTFFFFLHPNQSQAIPFNII